MRNKLAVGLAALALGVAFLGNVSTASVAQDNCEEIELLNARVRETAKVNHDETIEEANRGVAELEEEAALLGIKLTPELRARVHQEAEEAIRKAKRDLIRAQRDYAERECPLFG